MRCGCGRLELLVDVLWKWSVGGTRSSVYVVDWRYWMRCGCVWFVVLDAVCMWWVGGTICGVDGVCWRY